MSVFGITCLATTCSSSCRLLVISSSHLAWIHQYNNHTRTWSFMHRSNHLITWMGHSRTPQFLLSFLVCAQPSQDASSLLLSSLLLSACPMKGYDDPTFNVKPSSKMSLKVCIFAFLEVHFVPSDTAIWTYVIHIGKFEFSKLYNQSKDMRWPGSSMSAVVGTFFRAELNR